MADPDALRFLRIARADLREAQRMLELSGFRDSSIGFLLQQACEKAFKSSIYSLGGDAPFTHDLVALMDWLKDAGVSLTAYGSLADLTFFAVQSRYDDTIAITRPDWPVLIKLASALLDEVEDHLQ
jgi:HEPN domain-containing protein